MFLTTGEISIFTGSVEIGVLEPQRLTEFENSSPSNSKEVSPRELPPPPPKPKKNKLDKYETDETKHLTNQELQRLVLLEELQYIRLKKEKLHQSD